METAKYRFIYVKKTIVSDLSCNLSVRRRH